MLQTSVACSHSNSIDASNEIQRHALVYTTIVSTQFITDSLLDKTLAHLLLQEDTKINQMAFNHGHERYCHPAKLTEEVLTVGQNTNTSTAKANITNSRAAWESLLVVPILDV